MTISLPQREPIDDELVEAVAVRAWAPHEASPLGSWVLRNSGGFSAQGNSVALLGHADAADAELLDEAEAFYHQRGLCPRFQLSGAECDQPVSAQLRLRGYVHDAGEDTTMMVAPLRTLRSVAPAERDGKVFIADSPTEKWIDLWWSTQNFDPSIRDAANELIWGLSGRCGFAAHLSGGDMVAVGLGIIDGPWVGMFCLGTRPDRRRRGSARRVVGALATWGIADAAQLAYAEVSEHPADAKRLLEFLKFSPTYRTTFLRRPR